MNKTLYVHACGIMLFILLMKKFVYQYKYATELFTKKS